MSFLPVVSNVEDALRSWHLHGGIRLRPDDHSPEHTEYDAALNRLLLWCQDRDCWMMEHERFLWRKHRVENAEGDEWKSRYTLNHWQNQSDEAWSDMLQHFENGTFCGKIIAAVAELLMRTLQVFACVVVT